MDPIIKEAVDAVAKGELIVFPTDTVYGIGCDPFNEEALEKLFAAKKRPKEKSVPLLVDSIETAESLGEIDDQCRLLILQHWPGALTVIVPQKASLPVQVTKDNTVALRMPAHEDLLELLTATGGVLAATSANISGKPALTSYDEAYATFAEIADVVVPGIVKEKAASTIVDCTMGAPRIVREGPVEL